ncbi:MAG: carboxymuconolactone decarboxylase family protein [Amylibacter sp.]|nr:carboxymuconolactone decarboxylase family protein [Amylibacter sp.]
MTDQKITLPLQTAKTAHAGAAEILKMAESQLGFVPNLYANMANMPAILECYSTGYEKFRASAGFTPSEQETVFLSISYVNGCHYCLAAHSMVADKMQGMDAATIAALRIGDTLLDAKLDALAVFTREMVSRKGRPSSEHITAFFDAGYDNTAVLGIILGISVKVLSNYVNIISQTPLDPAFADYAV